MKREHIITVNEPESYISESYKILRSILSHFNTSEGKRIIMFASAHDDDDKTAVITNLSVSLAQSGMKVLLVEGDFRHPKLYDLFEVPRMPGLTNMIFEKKQLKECVHDIVAIKGLSVLTAGTSPVANLELFARPEFIVLMEEMKTMYDLVLIDVPPIMKYSDGTVLSKSVDGVILVAALDESHKDHLVKTREMLAVVHAKLLGVVVTKSKTKKKDKKY
ncbi:MAG: CpsD/CapB family tyrosine-protein kinase [Vallitaleaceae bacterium]|nr:CpsD/CapB family tyrosine-protein kinase [Vallitaleaceae bacterium]